MTEEKKKKQLKGMGRRDFMRTIAMGGAAVGLGGAVAGRSSEAAAAEREKVTLTVNGRTHVLELGEQADEVSPSHTLSNTLRDTLGLTGTKTPCNKGECGGCTVLMDGVPVLSCSTLTIECNGKSITTIEGVADAKTGKLHPIQQAFVDHDAIQCGMCTPGMVMSSKALLDKNKNPSELEIREAISGNLCRCTGYVKYVEAVQSAAKSMREK